MNSKTALEKAYEKLNMLFKAYALPICSCLIIGLAAYYFVFTNKLLNLDEIAGLFKKGESISSGRWALWLSSFIFPNASMPWINGMLSLFMLTGAVVAVISLFEIRSGLMQLLLSGLMIAFPSQIITFSYMFTCAPYALALLSAVLSVYVFIRGGKWGWLYSAILMAFSLGIYQAYISVAASLYVVYIIKMIIDRERSEKEILQKGLKCIASLLAGLVCYYVINKLFMLLSGTEYNPYADASMNKDIGSILFGLRVAYTAFLGYFYRGYYHLAATEFSQLVHILCALIVGVELALFFFRDSSKGRKGLLLLCVILLPLAVNCLYVVSSLRHSLMLYSFTAVYVLAAVCCEKLMDGRRVILRDALCVLMALIVCCNVVYANRLYLKMKLEYENAYSFYQGLVSRVKAVEGFDEDTMVVITGEAHNLIHQSEIDTSDIVGIMEGLINVYSQSDFIQYYIGFTPAPINWDEWSRSGGNELIESMPEYPYEGSVQKVGDFVVVKLG